MVEHWSTTFKLNYASTCSEPSTAVVGKGFWGSMSRPSVFLLKAAYALMILGACLTDGQWHENLSAAKDADVREEVFDLAAILVCFRLLIHCLEPSEASRTVCSPISIISGGFLEHRRHASDWLAEPVCLLSYGTLQRGISSLDGGKSSRVRGIQTRLDVQTNMVRMNTVFFFSILFFFFFS